jgi:hypothetical protein
MESKIEAVSLKLFNMMQIIDDFSYDRMFATRYIADIDIDNRNYSVTWMKQVEIEQHNNFFCIP